MLSGTHTISTAVWSLAGRDDSFVLLMAECSLPGLGGSFEPARLEDISHCELPSGKET